MAREKAPQDANDKAQRRVYVLPNELVERIAAYQEELGLASEVEAVRRLLDGALKSRDTPFHIAQRIYLQHKLGKPLQDAIRDVLWGHPMLSQMVVESDATVFVLKDDRAIRFEDDGKATILYKGKPIMFEGGKPEWASYHHEEIPF